MRFALLGPLLLADDADDVIPVEGARLRALLAGLLLHANAPVPAETLADAVWDGNPPSAAARTLTSHVGRLRRLLGPQAWRLVARANGYLIRVEPTELDILEFERLCREASVALHQGAWQEAADAAAGALGLWRGEPLADVPSQVLRDSVVPRLERLLVQTQEEWTEAELALGHHSRLVAPLRDLVAAYPLRERLHAQLMLALARADRRAEALEAYQGARATLVDELGIEPGPQLRALHKRILAGDESDLATPAPGPAGQAASTELPAPRPRQLPAAAGHFTGRSGELEWLTGLPRLSGPTGVAGTVVISAIDGMAGIGKTALAVHAAHRLADRFEGGQLFLDLHGYTQGHPPREPRQALEALLRALGVSPNQIPEDTEQCSALYRQRLSGTRTLIVLDNALNEAQVRPLLPGEAGCLVLVTSRRKLKGLDDARSLSLDLLPPADAVALLHAVAGPERIAADDPLLGEIATLCGHLPLALRIAGALLRHRPTWSLGHLATPLRDQRERIPSLSDGERDLATVFDLSYRHLDQPHRLLLCRLGLAPGPDTDPYAAAALSDTDPATATRRLENLADHNLLITHVRGRYRLHDLIRAHAAALADTYPRPERDHALGRLLHYYAHTAQTASMLIGLTPRPEPPGPASGHAPEHHTPDTARAWLRTEYPNLDAAFVYARAHALDEHTIALAAGMAEVLHSDGPWARALEIHQTAAATAESQNQPAAHANALNDLGRMRALIGDVPAATEAVERALKIHRQIGNHLGEANSLNDLGRVRYLSGDFPAATDALDRVLEIYRRIGHHLGEANALNNLGRVRYLSGDFPAATDAMEQALKIYRQIGNRTGEANALNNLGRVRYLSGDFPAATDAMEQALKIYRQIGNRTGEANTLNLLGQIRHATGNFPAAAHAQEQALEIYRQIGNRNGEAWALNHYAATVAATGDRPRALELYQQALAMNRELNKPDDEAISLEGIAEHHLGEGDLTQGADHLREALEIFQRLGMTPDVERVRARLAGVNVGHRSSTDAGTH